MRARPGAGSSLSRPINPTAGPAITHDPPAPTLVLVVGLPAAGKTTRAAELAAALKALRLTPDHWMIPLFGDSMADGKRFVLEGRLDLAGWSEWAAEHWPSCTDS